MEVPAGIGAEPAPFASDESGASGLERNTSPLRAGDFGQTFKGWPNPPPAPTRSVLPTLTAIDLTVPTPLPVEVSNPACSPPPPRLGPNDIIGLTRSQLGFCESILLPQQGRFGMGFNTLIANERDNDLSWLTTHPLRPCLSAYPPPPLNSNPWSRSFPMGAVNNAYEGFSEMVDVVTGEGTDPFRPLYTAGYTFLVNNDRDWLHGYCLSPFLDPYIGLLADPLDGERFGGLVAQHWPVTWSMLTVGITNDAGYGLFKVRTDRLYWFMGRFLKDMDPDRVAICQSVRRVAFLSLSEVLGFQNNMPGVERTVNHTGRLHDGLDTADKVLGTATKALGFISALATVIAGS